MQPRLSISYTGSATSNGRLGVGFVLSGLSAITPCRATYASEGHADGPEFGRDEYGTASPDLREDAYCLDGQKLVPDPWTMLGNGTKVFRTEVESYQRVVAHGLHAGVVQPTAFTVYSPDGGRREYEALSGKQLRNEHAASTPVADDVIAIEYRLARAYDRTNNRIEYHYEDADLQPGELGLSTRIARIDYAFDGVTPKRQIRFLYRDTRLDPQIAYRWGVRVVDRHTLSTIQIYAPADVPPTSGGSELVKAWEYLLDYVPSPDTGRSMLSSVRMRDTHGVESWARTFSYTTATQGPPVNLHHVAGNDEFGAAAMSYDYAGIASYAKGRWFRGTDTRLVLFDVDGDGDSDALYRTAFSGFADDSDDGTYTLHAGKLSMRLSMASAPLAILHDMSGSLEPGLAAAAPGYTLGAPAEFSLLSLGKTRVGDINADGHVDLMLARTTVDTAAFWEYPSADPDGNALQNDTLFQQRWTLGTTLYAGYTDNGVVTPPYKLSEHPGLDEAAVTGEVFTATTEPGPGGAVLGRWFSMKVPDHQRVLADLDGDGRLDTIDPFLKAPGDPSGPIDTSLSGTPTVSYRATRSSAPGTTPVGFDFGWACGNGFATPTDLDGDGRQDVLVASDVPSATDPWRAGVYHRLALDDLDAGFHAPDGTARRGFLSSLYVGTCQGDSADLVFGDWNGDGLVDALYPPGSYVDPAAPQNANVLPIVRWNLGTSFGPAVPLPVHGAPGIADKMNQPVPLDSEGSPVRWDRGTRVADVDGDGRTDIVAFREKLDECVTPFTKPQALIDVQLNPDCTHDLVVFRSRGTHFVGESFYGTNRGFASLPHGFTTSQIGDVTGDGAIDAVMVTSKNLVVVELPWRNPPDLLQEVTDTGVAKPLDTFEYSRSWWGKGPRPEGIALQLADPGPCAWPLSCRRAGMPVVTRHTQFAGTAHDGTHMYQTSLHRYARPRSSLTGRGFLGFATHEIWERERGAWTKRIFSNDRMRTVASGAHFFPTAALPDEEIRVVYNARAWTPAELAASTSDMPGLTAGKSHPVVTTWTTNTYEFPASTLERVLRVRRKATTTSHVEQTARVYISDGFPYFAPASNTGIGSQTETSFTYDEFGGGEYDIATTTSTVIRDGNGGGTAIRRKRVVRPEHREDRWLIGLPAYTAFSTTQGSVVPTEVTRREFDVNGDVEREIVAATDSPTCSDPSCELVYTTTTISSRDEHGNVLASSTSDGTTTRTAGTTWDAPGIYPTSETDATGFTASMTMHPWFGTPMSTTSIDNVVESTVYDGFGRVRYHTRSGAPMLERSYSLVNGRIEALDVLGDGERRFERYDELGRAVVTGVRGSNNNAWSYSGVQYDTFGNRVGSMYPSFVEGQGPWATSSYDRLGRTLKRTTPDHDSASLVRTTTFTPGLRASSVRDPAGHIAHVEHDHAGRVTRTYQIKSGGTYGALAYTYGAFDRVATITDSANNVTTLEHDVMLRRLIETTPDTGATTTFYDGFGQVRAKHSANGDVVTNTFDPAGRVVTSTTTGEGVTSHVYDIGPHAAGKLTSVTSSDGVTTSYTYNTHGRVHSVAQELDGTELEMVFRYDSYGRPRYVFYPEVPNHPRFKVRFDYAANSQLYEVLNVSACNISTTPGAVDPYCSGTRIRRILSRNAARQVTSAVFGPLSRSDVRTYGPTGRLDTHTVNNLATRYDYDADGLLELQSDDKREEHYDYDELHRLTSWGVGAVAQPQRVTGYVYDPLGNLESTTVDGVTAFSATYGWNGRPHAIASSTTASTYNYDAKGRQTAAGTRTIAFNSLDLPKRVNYGRSYTDYLYDGQGQRALKTSRVALGSVTGQTRYFGRSYEHRVAPSADDLHVFYVYAEGALVAQAEYSEAGAKTRYAVGDLRGSPTMYEANGAAEQQYFDPFGERIDPNTHAPINDPDRSTTRGFTGHEDDAGGLVNMQGRIYDRKQFRFVSPDPVLANPWFGQSYNPYSYVLNDPVNLVDPTGLTVTITPNGEYIFDGDPLSARAPDHPLPPSGEHGELTIAEPPPVPSTGLPGGASSDESRAGEICYVPGREPAPQAELGEPADSPELGRRFTAPEWQARDGRHRLREHLNRGPVERLSQSTSVGLQVFITTRFTTKFEAALLLASMLVDEENPEAQAALQAAALVPSKKRWLGTPTLKIKGAVFARQKGLCAYCGVEMTRKPGPRQMQLDHGADFKTNGPMKPIDATGACRTCNLEKADRDIYEYHESIRY